MAKDRDQNILTRMHRMEARIVRGFAGLGVNVVDEVDWFKVDLERKRVLVKYSGKSIANIWLAMRDAGCVTGDLYELYVAGDLVGGLKMKATP